MSPTLLDASTYLELAVKECGREVCIADKVVHFTAKDYCLIHYVYSGEGELVAGGKSYRLNPGDCFLIPPGKSATYHSYPDNPWSYFWLGIGGTKSAALLERSGFDEAHPVHHDAGRQWKKRFEAIYESYFTKGTFGLDALGEALLLLDAMSASSEQPKKDERPAEKGHIQAAKAYIRNNFQFPITITDVSRSVGVNPNYLANLFAKRGEKSPKAYLTEVRMVTAGKLLTEGEASVTEIARAVGYSSPLHFSKAFSAYYGHSPLRHRSLGGKSK